MEKVFTIPIVDVSKNGDGKICGKIIVSPQREPRVKKSNSEKLNTIIQDNLTFFQAEKYALLLSANERILLCERYLANIKDRKLSEIEIITSFSIIAMLHDALKYAYNLIALPENADKEKKNAFLQTPEVIFTNTIKEIQKFLKQAFDVDSTKSNANITDDEVIEMLRSLIFAHPCDTTRAGFLFRFKNLHLYSPWAFIYQEKLVLRIYYKEQMYDLHIPIFEIMMYVDFLSAKILELKASVEQELRKEEKID